MSVPENQKNEIKSGAKEIDTGAIPLPLSNVLFGLPYKPDPATNSVLGVKADTWDYGKLISQKKLLATITINNETSGPLWNFWCTWGNVVNTHVGVRNQNLFLMRHWDLNFLFEFRSNFQQVGQSIIYFSNCPAYAANFLRQDLDKYQNITQLPHVKVNMGEDIDVPVIVKWNSPLNGEIAGDNVYQGPDENREAIGYDMGTLYLSVPWKMEIATNVWPEMTVRIWSWLSSTSYGGYNPTDDFIE